MVLGHALWIGSSGGHEDAGRVEHGGLAVSRTQSGQRLREQGGTRQDRARGRRAPGPGINSPVECPRRDRRCGRLARAPRSRTWARQRRRRKRIRLPGQVANQSGGQRRAPRLIGPGGDEVRAPTLRARGRDKGQRQERYKRSCPKKSRFLENERSRHDARFRSTCSHRLGQATQRKCRNTGISRLFETIHMTARLCKRLDSFLQARAGLCPERMPAHSIN
jgi:hypothetical protein